MKFRNYQNRTTILIPMRALDEGKSRLSNVLSPSSRSRLVELLFSQLLKKLNILRCQFPPIFSDIVVITPCKKVKELSEEFDAIVLEEPMPNNLNSALTLGLSWSYENDYNSSLIIPGDIIDPLTKDIKNIRQELKVVWDAGNGAVGNILKKMIKLLPGKHLLLNFVLNRSDTCSLKLAQEIAHET